MANPERGEVRLEVDGTGYVLKLDLTNIVAMQKQTGKPLGSILDAVNLLDVEMIAAVLWSALQVHHSRQFKQIDTVVAFMEKAGGLAALPRFIDAITDLVKQNKPATTEAGVEANPPTAGGTVESSISEPVRTPA